MTNEVEQVVMRLPEKFILEGMSLADGALFMGHSLHDLTKDELIAVAAKGWKAYSDQLQDGIRTLDMLSSFRR